MPKSAAQVARKAARAHAGTCTTPISIIGRRVTEGGIARAKVQDGARATTASPTGAVGRVDSASLPAVAAVSVPATDAARVVGERRLVVPTAQVRPIGPPSPSTAVRVSFPRVRVHLRARLLVEGSAAHTRMAGTAMDVGVVGTPPLITSPDARMRS